MPHHHLKEPEWVDRFLGKLGTLYPGVHPAGANARALEFYAEGPELGPEEAAEAYTRELTQGEPGQDADEV